MLQKEEEIKATLKKKHQICTVKSNKERKTSPSFSEHNRKEKNPNYTSTIIKNKTKKHWPAIKARTTNQRNFDLTYPPAPLTNHFPIPITTKSHRISEPNLLSHSASHRYAWWTKTNAQTIRGFNAATPVPYSSLLLYTLRWRYSSMQLLFLRWEVWHGTLVSYVRRR